MQYKFPIINTIEDVLPHIEDIEEFIVIKKDDYDVTSHETKDAIGREKDLIKAYLTTGIDDILPILSENDKKRAINFLSKLTVELVNTSKRLDGIFVNIIEKLSDSFTRKEFTLQVIKLDPKYKPFMFSLLSGRPCMEILIPVLTRASQSKKALDEYRWLIGGIRYNEKDIETV